LHRTRRAAYADGTHQNNLTQWRTFLSFCIHFNLDYLPVSLDAICLYFLFLSRSLTPQSFQNYTSGVKLFHIIVGFPFPHTLSFELKITLRGISRLAQRCPKRVSRVTPFILRVVADISDFSKEDGMVYEYFRFQMGELK